MQDVDFHKSIYLESGRRIALMRDQGEHTVFLLCSTTGASWSATLTPEQAFQLAAHLVTCATAARDAVEAA